MLNIDHILKLARIELGNDEKKDIENRFSSILEFIKKLENVDTDGVEPMSHSIKVESVMREDKIKLKIKNEKLKTEERLLKMAPEKKDGYIKTKQIL